MKRHGMWRWVLATIACGFLAADAGAQQVQFGRRQAPGEKTTFSQAMDMKMKISAAGFQMDQNVKNMRSGTATVEAVDANSRSTKTTFVFDGNNGGEASAAGQTQKVPSALANKTITVTKVGEKDLNFSAEVDAEGAQEVTDLFRGDKTLLPSKPIAVGESWEVAPEEMKKLFPGGEGGNMDAKGAGKLLSVDTVGGRQVAKVEFTLTVRGGQQGMNMGMSITGQGLVDVATSQPLDLTLSGPIKGGGQQAGPQGNVDVTIDGSISMAIKSTITGGAGGIGVIRPGPGPGPGVRPLDPFAGGPGINPLGSPFVGTFNDEKMTLTLAQGAGGLTGSIKRGANEFPVTTANAAANKLTGQFKAGDSAFDFSATIDGDTVTFQTGNTTYTLKRQAAPRPANPLE